VVRFNGMEALAQFIDNFQEEHSLKVEPNLTVNKTAAMWLWKDIFGRNVASLTVMPRTQEELAYISTVAGGPIDEGSIEALEMCA